MGEWVRKEKGGEVVRDCREGGGKGKRKGQVESEKGMDDGKKRWDRLREEKKID